MCNYHNCTFPLTETSLLHNCYRPLNLSKQEWIAILVSLLGQLMYLDYDFLELECLKAESQVVDHRISDTQVIWQLNFYQVTCIFGQLGWATSSSLDRYWSTK